MPPNTYTLTNSDYSEEQDILICTFSSVGKKTVIKIIEYAPIEKGGKKYYGLNFGDVDIKNEIDYYGKTDNGDARKVFNTVAATLPRFFEYHPDAIVFVEGSTETHMSVYINWVHLGKLEQKYIVKGGKEGKIEDFKPGNKYDFLLISQP